jgi:hypothetical protein
MVSMNEKRKSRYLHTYNGEMKEEVMWKRIGRRRQVSARTTGQEFFFIVCKGFSI